MFNSEIRIKIREYKMNKYNIKLFIFFLYYVQLGVSGKEKKEICLNKKIRKQIGRLKEER